MVKIRTPRCCLPCLPRCWFRCFAARCGGGGAADVTSAAAVMVVATVASHRVRDGGRSPR